MTTDSSTDKIRRQDLWRIRYEKRPYLEDSSNDELIIRFRDIVCNLTTLTKEGKIGLLPPMSGGAYWLELFTHIIEEFNKRGGVPEGILDKNDVPFASFPEQPKGVKALGNRKLKHGDYLLKFGKHQFLREMIDCGRIRIASAMSFSDPSLNHAIKDDELSISAYALKTEAQLEVFNAKTKESKGLIEPIGNIELNVSSRKDYYVYCMSHKYDFRLFDDFEADCCIIVNKPKIFCQRILKAVSKILPTWTDWNQAVNYFDPFHCTQHDLDVFFSKHFRFSYQHEFRFVWIPPQTPEVDLQPIFVELGPLSDITTLLLP